MRNVSEGQALLVAFVISCASLLVTFGLAVALSPSLSAKPRSRVKSADVSTEAISQGRRLFLKHCAECHGIDARGDEGSDLHNLRSGDGLIRQVITGGIKREMPGFGKVLTEADARALTVYLRTLRD
jgi:mono/diheme cytochrome c family protein